MVFGIDREVAMPIADFSAKHKKVLDEMLLEIPGVEPGKMFGLPGYFINGKLFACVWEDGVSLKVPQEVRDRLLEQKGVEPFVPMKNRPMKEWVLIKKKNSKDYLDYEDSFIAAIEYVLVISKKKPRKKRR
jgi:TfoX/Sxy family transcriptional regulator of competence genes